MSKRFRGLTGPGLAALGGASLWLAWSGTTGTISTAVALTLVAVPFTLAAVWIGLLLVEWKAAADPPRDSPETDFKEPPPQT